jgi:hypothetical protein
VSEGGVQSCFAVNVEYSRFICIFACQVPIWLEDWVSLVTVVQGYCSAIIRDPSHGLKGRSWAFETNGQVPMLLRLLKIPKIACLRTQELSSFTEYNSHEGPMGTAIRWLSKYTAL